MAGLRQTPLTCSGHTRPVVDLAFSEITPSGHFLISACKDGKPMLRQGETGDWVGTFSGHKGAVWGVDLNRDATRAATGAADFEAKLWDAVAGKELHTFPHPHIVKSVNFNTDGNLLLTASNDKKLRIFDLNVLATTSEPMSGHSASLKTALFLKDSRQAISAAEDKSVRLWDLISQQEVRKLEFESNPSSLELSRHGDFLVVTYGHSVSFFDTNSWEKLNEFEIPTLVNSASLHPDGSTFVCGGDDFKMYKYDYESGKEMDSFKGHFGPIHCVRFSPDGELYASGSEDGTLRLWQNIVGKTYGLWKCVLPGEVPAGDVADASTGEGQILKGEA